MKIFGEPVAVPSGGAQGRWTPFSRCATVRCMDGSPMRECEPSAQLTEAAPFAREFVTLSRQEHIRLVWEARNWKRLHHSAAQRLAEQEEEHRRRLQSQGEAAEEREQTLRRDLEYARGRIRDLEQRLFGG